MLPLAPRRSHREHEGSQRTIVTAIVLLILLENILKFFPVVQNNKDN